MFIFDNLTMKLKVESVKSKNLVREGFDFGRAEVILVDLKGKRISSKITCLDIYNLFFDG